MSTPDADVPMPDLERFVLPGRAYLLSVRDQNLMLRRAALADARAHYDEVAQSDMFEKQLALVGLIGDALQIVEDVAALVNAFFNAPPGIGFYVTAASYAPGAIHRFYDGLHKRPLDDFLSLVALRVGNMWIHDLFSFRPPLTDDERRASELAHEATAKLVRGHLLALAREWRQFRHYFYAYKHGLLVANPTDVTVVEDRAEEIEQLVVWHRRKATPIGFGSITPPYDDVARYVESVGRLAADVIEHLALSRLRTFDFIRIEEDGTLSSAPLAETPWLWWFRERDLAAGARRILSARYGMTFE